MKKLTVLAMILALVFIGCGSDKSDTEAPPAIPPKVKGNASSGYTLDGSLVVASLDITGAGDFYNTCYQKSEKSDHVMLMDPDDSGALHIASKISDTAVWEIKFDEDLDGLFLVDAMSIETISSLPSSGRWYTLASPMPSETLVGDTDTRYFASTQEDATITYEFTGTELWFYSYTDNRGGMWNFSIDGGDAIAVSVWKADPAAYAYQQIATGLSNTLHTVVGTFIGADPSHSPESGGPRGWIHYSPLENIAFFDGDGGSAYTVNKGGGIGASDMTEVEVTSPGSKIEFAISARGNGTGDSGDWIPQHALDTGATADIDYTVYGIRGDTSEEIPAVGDITDDVWYKFDSILIVQTYDAYNINDGDQNDKLWDGTIKWILSPTWIGYTHEITLAMDVDFTGPTYLTMMPFQKGEFTTISTPFQDDFVETTDEKNHHRRLADNFKGSNGTYDVGVKIVEPDDLFDLYRVSDNTGPFLFILDTANYNKIYVDITDAETLVSGTVLSCRVEYSFCEK